MNKLKLFIAFLVLVAFSQAQWKGFVAGSTPADVTASEALAGKEIMDATDGISAAEAGKLYDYAQAPGNDALVALTAAEVGYIDGATIANDVATKFAMLNAGGDIVTASNVGAVAVGTVTAAEYGDGFNHVTILTLTNVVLGTPDPGNALAFGDTLYVLPAGVQIVEWFQTDIGLTTGGVTTDTPEQGIGSVMGAGAQATLGAAGATMEDYFIGTAVTNCDGSIEAHGPLGATAGIFTGIALNKAADVKNICLNVADTWNGSVTGTLTASGTIAFKWTFLD